MRPIDLETDVGQDITQPRVAAAEARAASATDVMDGETETSEEVVAAGDERENAGSESEDQEQDEEA